MQTANGPIRLQQIYMARPVWFQISQPNFSCHTQTSQRVSNNSVADTVTIATFIDLSKAFDCLQYDKLFYKLNALDLTFKALNWFKSYLTRQKQCVDIDGTQSGWLDVELGVPQG